MRPVSGDGGAARGVGVNHRPQGHTPAFRGCGPGVCQVCGGIVTRADGKPCRRTWHDGRDGEPHCLRAHWFAAGDNGIIRLMVKERDGGVCAACPPGTPPCDTTANPEAWEADHIVPLIDGGEHSMANLQTLCLPHHKEKTAQEASARAAERRRDPLQEQLALT